MKRLIVLVALACWQSLVHAAGGLTIDITQGVEGAIPVAIVPFAAPGGAAAEVSAVIDSDLKRSGRFKTLPERDMLAKPHSGEEVQFRDWRTLGQDALVVGKVESKGGGQYQVMFQLLDVPRGNQLIGFSVTSSAKDLRFTAHRIADLIYEKLLGTPGAFATRVAYITEEGSKGNRRVSLRVADSDGYDPQTVVTSSEPLLSPAWSPDGRRLAYVSFENKQHAIYIQDIYSGQRRKVASFKGINSAPAWSPDGRSLALTLSKDGNPDIYVLDIASGNLRRLTNHFAIDTEPAWSPDGQSIVFTSDRAGQPQIYRVPAAGGTEQRVTFQGSYNARASYSPDGKSLVLVTRDSGRRFQIALLNIKSGVMEPLTKGELDESPSFAPNGSMVIYGTRGGGRGELSAVSVDGRVRQRLAVADGDVREPVWSPIVR